MKRVETMVVLTVLTTADLMVDWLVDQKDGLKDVRRVVLKVVVKVDHSVVTSDEMWVVLKGHQRVERMVGV